MNTLLSLLLFLVPIPTVETEVLLPDVVTAAVLGGDVLLIHADGSSTAVAIADVGIAQPRVVGAYGWPRLTLNAGPSSITTTYTSATGEHTVVTSCKSIPHKMCIKRHNELITLMQTIFPKKSRP